MDCFVYLVTQSFSASSVSITFILLSLQLFTGVQYLRFHHSLTTTSPKDQELRHPVFDHLLPLFRLPYRFLNLSETVPSLCITRCLPCSWPPAGPSCIFSNPFSGFYLTPYDVPHKWGSSLVYSKFPYSGQIISSILLTELLISPGKKRNSPPSSLT